MMTSRIKIAPTTPETVRDDFRMYFFCEPALFRAPGRISLIGEHTDYNQGFSMPAAIGYDVIYGIAPNDEPKRCRIVSRDFNDSVEFTLDDLSSSEQIWADYAKAVLYQLREAGHHVRGFNCVFGGNIPIGAGLSSSSAIQCGLLYALNQLFDLSIDASELASLAFKAEQQVVKGRGRIIDAHGCLLGKRDHVVLLDCQSMAYERLPVPMQGYKLVLYNTNVSLSTADTEIKVRRRQCEEGVEVLKKSIKYVESLRDVRQEMLMVHRQEFDATVFKRCLFIVNENKRVQKAAETLAQGDLKAFGQLLYQSHEGLAELYQVSSRQLDFLVSLTEKHPNVLGSKMMGPGFGGLTLNLVEESGLEDFNQMVKTAYKEKMGRELNVYVSDLADGVSPID